MNDREPSLAGIGSWKTRRRLVYANISFSMGVISYILYKNMQGTVPEHAVDMAFINLLSTIGTYVFGAVWQDTNTVKANHEVLKAQIGRVDTPN